MEKYQHMKSFISAVVEYTKHPSEATTSILQRNLGVISVTLDLSIFDPGSSIAAEFYVSLHELMNLLGSRTPIIWSALDVLQNACRNGAARRALIHTYKFAPILTRLLETNLTPEKRVRVLQLLQELTYGVKLSWQEAHLPYLISSLTQWVMQSKDEKIVTLSLGTLVNLCYKNLSAVYTLMRTVDAKTFMRTLLKVHSNNVNTRVQCCKLIIIMESTNNSIPGGDILEFVAMTFSSLVTALRDHDVLVLRHIVDFFVDASQVPHSKAVIVNYENYAVDVEKILSAIERDSDPECVALVMEFLLSLASLKLPSLTPLYPMCVKVAMSWIPSELACSKALALIRTIVVDSRVIKSSHQVLSELDLSMLMLVSNCQDDEIRSTETQSKLTELMQLLQEMARIPHLKNKVTQTFGEQSMRKLLKPLLEENDLTGVGEWPGNSFNDPATSLYVHALALTADLAAHDSAWLTLYSEILQKKQIHMIMALALYTGAFEVKQKVLQLTSSVGFPQECMSSVSRCMCELEPLLLIQNTMGTVPAMTGKNHGQSQNAEMAPLFSFNQESRLDSLLAKLEEAYNNNQIADITTSAVMELYDYKLAAIRHAERATQASLEAANNHATSLQHRLAQVVAESSRLHQLLFQNQQCLEGVRAEKANLSATLQTKVEKIQEIPKLKKIVSDKSATIECNNLVIADLKRQLETSSNNFDALTKKVKELESELSTVEATAKQSGIKNTELKKQMRKIQDNLNKKEQVLIKKEQLITEKEQEIASNLDGISALKLEIEQLTRQCRTYEQTIAEKEAAVQKMSSELGDLSRMTDMIYQLTAAKKKEDQNTTS